MVSKSVTADVNWKVAEDRACCSPGGYLSTFTNYGDASVPLTSLPFSSPLFSSLAITLIVLFVSCSNELLANEVNNEGSAETKQATSLTEGGEGISVLQFRKCNNDYQMIQAAINHASENGIKVVRIPDGDYRVQATLKDKGDKIIQDGINLKGDMHLKLSKGARLIAEPNTSARYHVLRVDGANNVIISGGEIIGDRSPRAEAGEWGMGIAIGNSTNVELRDITIKDCWGDAIYLMDGSKNILMTKVICDNNRRQGMTVVAVDGLIVRDSEFNNTKGTAPAAGIDFEPNKPTQHAKNVLIEGCKFLNNDGLELHFWGMHGPTYDVKVDNCIVDGNPIGVSLNNGVTEKPGGGPSLSRWYRAV